MLRAIFFTYGDIVINRGVSPSQNIIFNNTYLFVTLLSDIMREFGSVGQLREVDII